MRFRSLALSILIAAMLAGSIAPSVGAQVFFVTVPQPHASVHNQMIDFYAGGTTASYTLRVSSAGGTLSIGDYLTMGLMPWGYVTAKWTTGRIYIIFLVNVTQTNFRIGFLYLTNSSDQPFFLRLFDFNGDSTSTWTFQGAQHVYNRTVSTGSVELPSLKIPASGKVSSDMSAIGPELYLARTGGMLLNGSSLLRVYPLVNQLFGGPTDYNEVWSLLADDFGNYYFAILYMQNSDPSHVIIEHQLRLNDYRRLDGRTVDAGWIKGDFASQVTVRTPAPNVTVKVDGFPFHTNNKGIVSTGVPHGVATVEVPNEVLDSTNTKLRFAGWNKYGSSNPLTIKVNSSLDVTANYDREFPLSVTSAYGTAQGSGWYLQGTNATFSVENALEYGNGTRRVFQQWAGDSNSTEHQASIILNSPKQVVAFWKTQYEVTLSTVGLPSNVSTVVLVDNVPITLNGSAPFTQWFDANHQLLVTVQSPQIQGPGDNYVFSGLRVDNQNLTGTLDVTKPSNVILVYAGAPKLSTTISLQVAPPVAVPGLPLSITGSVGGLTGETPVIELLYSSGTSGWQKFATVPVTPNGVFAYTWQPNVPGDYSIKAYWPGDVKYSSASQVVGVRVLDSSGPTAASSDQLTQLLQGALAAAKEIPYLSALISLTASLMTLGYILTAFAIPGGSPLIGYLIGSVFVGFIFVFPISAAAVLVKAAKTKRRPSLLWLTPLLTVWLSSLALVVLGPAIATLQPLVLASQLLLVLSNTFAVPILTSFRLARLVA